MGRRGEAWVRITTGDQGGYAFSTAAMPVGVHKSYTYVIQTKAPDVASFAPEVYHEGQRHEEDDDDVVYRNEWPRRNR